MDAHPEAERERPAGARGCLPFRVPIGVALGVMALALVAAGLILSRVAGPLHGLLFPPELPVPKGAQQIEHGKPKTGAEYWIYRTDQSGEEVAAFYESEGGTCRYTPKPAGLSDPTLPQSDSYSVAECTGQKRRGSTGLGWQVYISTGYSEQDGPTIFRLYQYENVR